MFQIRLSLVFVFTSALLLHQQVSAQMPVDKEPHHKVAFENDWIRLIDLVVNPKDTTLVHEHSAASVVLFLTASDLVIQNEGQQPKVTPVKPGDVVFRNYGEQPVTHTVWIENNSSFRCLVIELKHQPSKVNCVALSGVETKSLWQQKLVDAYEVRLASKNIYSLQKNICPYVLINYSGMVELNLSGKRSIVKEGEFVFVHESSDAELMASKESKLILLQLK